MAADPQGGSTTPTTGARAPARYLLVAAALAFAYLVVVPVLWLQRGVVEDGPLSFRAPALTAALAPGHSAERLEAVCARQEPFSSVDYQRMKVVGGRVDGRVYYGCYAVAADGAVRGAAVIDRDLLLVKDVALLKRSGAWRWVGGVKTQFEAALGFAGLVGILGMYLLYYRRPRPGPPATASRQWWQGPGADIAFGVLACLGWLLLWVLPGRSLPRKVRVSFMYGFAYVPLFLLGAYVPVLDYPDALSVVVVGMLGVAVLWGWLGGRALLRGPGWGYPDQLPEARPPAAQPLDQPVPVPLPAGPSPAPPGPAPAPPPNSQNPGRSTVPRVRSPSVLGRRRIRACSGCSGPTSCPPSPTSAG